MLSRNSPELLDVQSRFLTALANANRLKILLLLQSGERTVGDLAETLGTSSSLVSQHLSLLYQQEFVAKRRDWRRTYYRSRIEEIDASLARFLIQPRT